MFNLQLIQFFHNIAINYTLNSIQNIFYFFNEDVKDIQNFHLISWDKSESLLNMTNATIRISMENALDDYMQLFFWRTAVDGLNIR